MRMSGTMTKTKGSGESLFVRQLTMRRMLVLCAVLLTACGCGPVASTPPTPEEPLTPTANPFRAEGVTQSPVAGLNFAALWMRLEPEHLKVSLAASFVGSASSCPPGTLLLPLAASLTSELADTPAEPPAKKRDRFTFDDAPPGVLIFTMFQSPGSSPVALMLLKSSRPSSQLPARMEIFQKLVDDQLKKANVRIISSAPASEPRPSYRILYETDTMKGSITLTIVRDAAMLSAILGEIPRAQGAELGLQPLTDVMGKQPLIAFVMVEKKK